MNESRHLHAVAAAANATQVTMPSLAQRYGEIRAATLALSAPLSDEDCAIQSMPDASPVKWHLAHTSWFFETFVLEPNLPSYREFNPVFRMLFNSYYNAVGDKHPRPARGILSRPARADVIAYRQHVDTAMQALLQGAASLPSAVLALIELGVNHEQQHQELILTDVLHLLSCNPLHPVYVAGDSHTASGQAPRVEWHIFDAALVEIGHAGSGFAFDNESPRHRQYLQRFELASRPVTNGEYLAFIADGGYRRAELWLSEGWDWINAQHIEAPQYWHRDASGTQQFTLHGM
ncbi:MAG TPA: DinB family protein, partial [Casimicrobiaceae bacterium]